MQDHADLSPHAALRDGFLIVASTVVILAGAHMASSIVSPFLLALFIAVICGSPIAALTQRGLPRWLAGSIVCLLIGVASLLMLIVLGSSGSVFVDTLPEYRARFGELMGLCFDWLRARGIELDESALRGVFDPGRAVSFFGGFLSGIGGTLSNLLLIVFVVIFMLADAPAFPAKIASSDGERGAKTLQLLASLVLSMNNYVITKTKVSLLTGALVWLGLWLLKVEFAPLWALLAFLLNFVPNIGSIAAAVPVVLLSLLQLDPLQTGLLILLYLSVNTLVGNVIEPAWMGQRLGLSTLAVFLSLIFWGWMFGAVGMLLSVPLTMCLKFLSEQNPSTAWLGVLLANAEVVGVAPASEEKAHE
jgi:predicted PurR-regulated permease PerM